MNDPRKFAMHKLIRDKIPEKTIRDKVILDYEIYSDDEYLKALNNKLIEESREVITAQDNDELREELADVLEVLRAIAQAHSISFDDVELARQKKRDARGGFDKKIFGKTFVMDKSNPAYEYYKNQPENYPEISLIELTKEEK